MKANERQVGGDHYKNGKLEHWDLIERYGVGYLEGCATKYISRHHSKAGRQDVQKADHYVQKLLELYDEGVRLPRGVVPHKVIDEFAQAQGLGATERGALHMLLHWSERCHLEAAKKDIADLLLTYGDA